MTLRECISAKITDKKLRKTLLGISDDTELQAEALANLGVYKKTLNNLVRKGRKRQAHIMNMEKFKTGSWANPAKKTYNPQKYVRSQVGEMERKGDALIANFHADLDAALRKAQTDDIGGTWWGRKDEGYLKKLAHVIHGGKVENNELMMFGEAWKALTDDVAKMKNAAGGSVNVKDDFFINHTQSRQRVYDAGFEKWSEDMHKYLDKSDLLWKTSIEEGKSIDDVLKEAYENIIDPAKHGPSAGKAFRRRFNFKDGNAWYEFNQLYGDDNVFDAMMKYVDSSARQIAAFETFGPQPRDMVKSLIGDAGDVGDSMVMRGQKVKTGNALGNAAVHQFDNINGFVNGPTSDTLAKVGQVTRVGQTVTKLGLATISAVTDVAFGAMAASMKGMPIIQTMFKQLGEVAAKGDTKFMAQIGIISDVVADQIRSAHRFADLSGNGRSIKVANAYIKGIGLSRWTNAMKVGHAYQALAHVTNLRAKEFGKLHKGLQVALKEQGIDQGVWSHLATAPLIRNKGAEFINVAKIADYDARIKLTSFLQTEARYAVPEPNAAARATINQGFAPGTWTGEILRTAGQFKSFPITVAMQQFARIESLPTHGARLFYAGQLLTGTTALGALALWAKDIAKGRQMTDIDERFVFDSMVQGGATSIIGDIFQQTAGGFGSKLGDFFLGPSFGMLKMIASSPKEILDAMTDPDSSFAEYGGELSSTALKNLGNSFSYAKLLANRLVLDGMRETVYPKIKEQRKRTEQRMKKEGKEFYTKPGEDLSKAKPLKVPKFTF